MTFEPSGDLETPYVFEQTVVGGAVPKNYFPAVEKGIQESVLKGPLASYPVVGVKATLYDGSYHPVDSSEIAGVQRNCCIPLSDDPIFPVKAHQV